MTDDKNTSKLRSYTNGYSMPAGYSGIAYYFNDHITPSNKWTVTDSENSCVLSGQNIKGAIIESDGGFAQIITKDGHYFTATRARNRIKNELQPPIPSITLTENTSDPISNWIFNQFSVKPEKPSAEHIARSTAIAKKIGSECLKEGVVYTPEDIGKMVKAAMGDEILPSAPPTPTYSFLPFGAMDPAAAPAAPPPPVIRGRGNWGPHKKP